MPFEFSEAFKKNFPNDFVLIFEADNTSTIANNATVDQSAEIERLKSELDKSKGKVETYKELYEKAQEKLAAIQAVSSLRDSIDKKS